MNRLEAIWDVSDPESALIREVYARYGLAMYMAQVLEHAIVNALLVLRFLPTRPVHNSKESWESAFDDFYIGEFGKTFGNMLKTLALLWQICNFWDSLFVGSVIHREPADGGWRWWMTGGTILRRG
jgi:hypothetical protein